MLFPLFLLLLAVEMNSAAGFPGIPDLASNLATFLKCSNQQGFLSLVLTPKQRLHRQSSFS